MKQLSKICRQVGKYFVGYELKCFWPVCPGDTKLD